MRPWIYCPFKEEGDLTFNTKQLKFYSIIDTYVSSNFWDFKVQVKDNHETYGLSIVFYLRCCFYMHNFA
jgi:hypothetical protein